MLARLALALVLLLGFAAPAGAQTAPNPLVGEWHLDQEIFYEPGNPESYRYTPDSSGSGRHFDYCNGCSTIEGAGGRFGGYLSELSNNPLITGPGSNLQRVTLVAWVRTNVVPPNSRVIAGRWTEGLTCEELPYSLRQEGGDGSPGASFSIRRPDGSAVSAPLSAPINDNQWHMLAGTFDGTTVRLYVDGQQVGNGTAAGTTAIGYGAGGGGFGIDGYVGSGCDSEDFGGGIDEVREYNRALTATEIARIAAPGATSPPPLVPDGSVPPPQPPSPPAPPPTAVVTGGGTVAANGQAIFNAGGSQNVVDYQWSVGSGGDSIRTQLPVLAVRTPLPGTYPIKLTTVSTGGQTATASTVLKVTGKQPPKSLPNAALPPPIATAAGGTDFFRRDEAEDALKTCQGATVVFGLAEAKSCFSRIHDIRKVPAAERAVVKAHYANEGFNGIVNTLCAQAARGVTPQSKCDDARAYFGTSSSALDVYVSKQTVNFNGLRIIPQGGARVVVYPKQERIISSRAIVRWGSFPVSPVPKAVDYNLAGVSGSTSAKNVFPGGGRRLLNFDARKALSDIGGFPMNGGNFSADLWIRAESGRRFSTADVSVNVPLLDAFGGKSPSLRTRVKSDNSGRVAVEELEALLPEANLGAIRLRNLSFKYRDQGRIDNDYNEGTTCPRKEWKVRGDVYFGVLDGAVKMTPPPPQNGLGFCAGGFKHFGAQVNLPNPKPILFPGVQLNNVNFAVGLDPLLFRGGAGIEVAKVNRVNGEIVAVFASPGAPYRFGPGDRQYFRDLQGLDPFKSPTFAVGGEVFTRIPIFGDIRLGEGAILYSYPDYFAFGGKASFTAALITVTGGLSGWFRFGSGKFQLGGGIRACLAVPKPFNLCRGASAYVGSRGISACIEAFGLDVGAGYRWGEAFPVLMLRNNCKHSPFWERNTARVSATSDSFTVARGEKNKSVMVRGAGGASPSIEVRSPSGEVVSTAGNPLGQGKTMSVLRLERGATYIGVENGRPGRYTINTLPGSAQLGRIANTRPGYDTEFKARVTGKGAVRTLVYDARKRGGQSVTFVERGSRVARPLKTVKGGKGKFRFKPSVVPGRARTIVAVSTLNGYAIPDQTLARFRAPGIPRTGRPRKLSVRRKGTVLRVRWRKARGAKRYGVALRLSNGRMRMFRVSARRRSLRIRRVPRDLAGRVEVSAQGVLLDWGRVRSKRFKRLAVPFTVVQTNRINEKRTAKREAAKAKKRKAAKRRAAKRKRARRRN